MNNIVLTSHLMFSKKQYVRILKEASEWASTRGYKYGGSNTHLIMDYLVSGETNEIFYVHYEDPEIMEVK